MSVGLIEPLHLAYLRTFSRIFERGETSFRGLFSGPVTTFESNIPFILRFMIDTNVRVIECCSAAGSNSATGRRHELDRNPSGKLLPP